MNTQSSSPAETEPPSVQYLVIANNRARFSLPVQNIVRLESKRVYTIVYLKNHSPYVCSRNIKVVYEELQSTQFFRVHKSHVINLNEVKAYHDGRGGQVIMSDNSVIAVAQRKRTEFLKTLNGIFAIRRVG